MPLGSLSFLPIHGIPEVVPGDDLASILAQALDSSNNPSPRDGDVLVVAQKIVSKAENRYVELDRIEPSARALDIAAQCRKDARLVELVLRESSEVLRVAPNVLIVRHRLGFVVANAAIDQSNLADHEGERALLLPADPDASAQELRARLQQRYGLDLPVLISDSFGRPFRLGVCGVCIGCSGLQPLVDLRGQLDRNGRSLQVTQIAVADQLCAAATLVGGEADEGIPLVIVRGLASRHLQEHRNALELIRPRQQDLFS